MVSTGSEARTFECAEGNSGSNESLRATVPNKGEAVTEFESGEDEVPVVDKLVAGEVNADEVEDASSGPDVTLSRNEAR